MRFSLAFVVTITSFAASSIAAPAAAEDTLLAAPGDCTPGTYTCHPNGTGILVCNTGADWETAAYCGGRNCCRNAGGPGTPHCFC
jgi:hypothetical protein